MSPSAREDGYARGVIILTARDGELDRVVGLDVGADEYLAKPFGLSGLLARVRAVLRRQGKRTVGDEVFQRGTSDRDSDGHGLGLTIASQLATSLGGYLVLADAPTTTFVLVLPAPGVNDLIHGSHHLDAGRVDVG